jgi:hypothetical protein
MKPVVFNPLRFTSEELFYSCCGSVAAPRATAWAPRSSTCGAPRASVWAHDRVKEETAWAPRSSTCDAHRAAPRATARAPRSSTCDLQRAVPRAAAWEQRSIICDAQRAAPRAAAWADTGESRCAHSPQAPLIRLFLYVPSSPTSRIALQRSGV